jgi:hypothetical protein
MWLYFLLRYIIRISSTQRALSNLYWKRNAWYTFLHEQHKKLIAICFYGTWKFLGWAISNLVAEQLPFPSPLSSIKDRRYDINWHDACRRHYSSSWTHPFSYMHSYSIRWRNSSSCRTRIDRSIVYSFLNIRYINSLAEIVTGEY